MSPTYAYVEYKDGGRAIVAVSLIKDFEPATLEDTARNKKVYWRSELRQEEGFYPGDIVLLGLNKADLVTRMRKGHKPVPDSIFDAGTSISDSSHAKTSAEGALTAKEKKHKKASAKKHLTKRILSQKRKATRPESEDEWDSDDDELVPKKLLHLTKNRVRELEAKLQLSERRRLEEVRRSRGLQELLEERTSLCTQMSSLKDSVNQALLALKGAATPALDLEPLPKAAPPISHTSCSPVRTGPGCATSSANQQPTATMMTAAQVELSMQPEEVPPATAASHLEAAPATEPEPLHPVNTEELFVVSNGKVPVAPGFSISSDRWEWLNKAKTDSLFVRDTVRTLWKPEALKDRSVTGKPCMAKLKAGVQGKKELTPEKLGAVRSAYGYFVNHRNSEAPKEKRLKAFNGYVANLLRDMK